MSRRKHCSASCSVSLEGKSDDSVGLASHDPSDLSCAVSFQTEVVPRKCVRRPFWSFEASSSYERTMITVFQKVGSLWHNFSSPGRWAKMLCAVATKSKSIA